MYIEVWNRPSIDSTANLIIEDTKGSCRGNDIGFAFPGVSAPVLRQLSTSPNNLATLAQQLVWFVQCVIADSILAKAGSVSRRRKVLKCTFRLRWYPRVLP